MGLRLSRDKMDRVRIQRDKLNYLEINLMANADFLLTMESEDVVARTNRCASFYIHHPSNRGDSKIYEQMRKVYEALKKR